MGRVVWWVGTWYYRARARTVEAVMVTRKGTVL
jgi:hypothetical protein